MIIHARLWVIPTSVSALEFNKRLYDKVKYSVAGNNVILHTEHR